MHLSTLVEMVESAFDDRVVLGDGVTGAQLGRSVRAAAPSFAGYSDVLYVGENHPQLPVALLAAAWSGVPFVPLNYRLDDRQLHELVTRHDKPFILADAPSAARLQLPATVLDDWLESLDTLEPDPARSPAADDQQVAVVLYTSGTTAAPKAALLRHRHLMAYLFGSVEFGSARSDDAMLVAVPPYHIAGVANMLSNIYAGRRLVYLRSFNPRVWLDVVASEGITNAMVVPTMLARIVEQLDGSAVAVPTLRSLSYGGAKLSEQVLRSAVRLFPDTGFVNAYGLTETASTIAVLSPEDHRAALESEDPLVQRRLISAGRVLPTVEVEVRDDQMRALPAGEVGLIYVRGDQIAGEYATGSVLDSDGWFCTRDHGWLDPDGYLFVVGRADDTIIRGGENIAPDEIEQVLLAHPAVAQACVVGIPDDEWGQRIVAAVVTTTDVAPEALQEFVRSRLRSSKVPERIEFRETLPMTETGKMLRRVVLTELSTGAAQ
ncbi:class I adenylate-forming enzyme family protein [Pseudonocardia sp. RS010]|uniref:class I adenylate-forming enzyme family protein n=1 Tax=Pseudonocardia sp. RS010 TaxID=3385979 RepID=UPI00399FACF6